MNLDYADILRTIHQNGMSVAPRGKGTHELLAGQVSFRAGQLVTRKGINHLLGWAELTMLLSESFDVELIKRVAPKANLALFTDQAAYGPRLKYYHAHWDDGHDEGWHKSQMPQIIEGLREDPTTRQAVLYIGRPEEAGTSGLPCTSTVQFLRRQGLLNAVVTMRSWDAIFGLPYDIMMFGGLVHAVARCVSPDLQSGYVIVNAGSLHIYDSTAHLGEDAGNAGLFGFLLPGHRLEWADIVNWATEQRELLRETKKMPPGIYVEEG